MTLLRYQTALTYRFIRWRSYQNPDRAQQEYDYNQTKNTFENKIGASPIHSQVSPGQLHLFSGAVRIERRVQEQRKLLDGHGEPPVKQ